MRRLPGKLAGPGMCASSWLCHLSSTLLDGTNTLSGCIAIVRPAAMRWLPLLNHGWAAKGLARGAISPAVQEDAGRALSREVAAPPVPGALDDAGHDQSDARAVEGIDDQARNSTIVQDADRRQQPSGKARPDDEPDHRICVTTHR